MKWRIISEMVKGLIQCIIRILLRGLNDLDYNSDLLHCLDILYGIIFLQHR